MASTLEEAKLALAEAKNNMGQYYSCCCTLAPVCKIGDMVYLDSQNICITLPSQKLAHCYLGPYKVEKPVGTHAYHLKLPAAMSCLHPVFHVVKLLPALQDPIPGRQPVVVIQCVYVYACTFVILLQLALRQGHTCGNK
jgi:hypothetical protein